MASTISPRPHQIVVWGASGFTGRLVCEHIVRDYQGKIRWAMAGRDAKKLAQVRDELAKINPAAKDVPILTADAMDAPAVSAVVGQAEVVLATAGPFARYGDNVVAAAVQHGTHYADITGEVNWVKRSIAKNHAAAVANGAKILHCCGYDSIPSDLGAYMMVSHCREKLGCGVSQVFSLVRGGSGGVSGGTIESAFNLMTTETTAELAAMNSDQYYLASLHGLRGPDKPNGIMPRYLPAAGTWVGPFLMESVNSKIVQCSNSLLVEQQKKRQEQGKTALAYGQDFRYLEAVATTGALGAGMVSAAMVMMGAVVALPPLRMLAKRFLPAPGQGPSEEARKGGSWRNDLVAVTDEPTPRVVRGSCGDPKRDPGYWGTSRMLLETGLALVLDAPRLAAEADAGRVVAGGGVLTPASACGPVLLERLKAAGLVWEVQGVEGAEGAGAAATAGSKEPVAAGAAAAGK